MNARASTSSTARGVVSRAPGIAVFLAALAMIFLAAQCLLVGIFFNQIVRNLIEPAAMIIMGGK